MTIIDDISKLAEALPDLLLLIDKQGIIRYASPSCTELTGRNSGQLVSSSLFTLVFEQDLPRIRSAFDAVLKGRPSDRTEYRHKLEGGAYLWVDAQLSPITDGDSVKYVLIMARDVSMYKRKEEELTHMAYYDPLTGLPNRRLFQDRYTQAMLAAKRYRYKLAVLYLDLDDFKQINDSFGHAVGDELLKIAAARLVNCLRDPDTICRVGGDEFIILLQQFVCPDDIEKIARRMIESLAQKIRISSNEITVTCSIGAAMYPMDSDNADMLIELADAAMYLSKKSGKNHFCMSGKP